MRLVPAVLAVALAGTSAHAETLHSKDGSLAIELSDGWQEARAGSPVRATVSKPERGLFGSALAGSMQLLVFEESKEDIAVKTLAAYADLVSGLEAKKTQISGRVQGKGTLAKLAGKDALRFEVRGTVQSVNFLWIKFFTQTAGHWVQIACWSTPSNKDKLAHDCAEMAASFAEVH